MTDKPISTTLKGSGDAVLHARTTLVLYHRDGSSVAHMDKGKSLVVGRTAPSDVEIPDPGLSRQHARFTWDDQGIWVEDLKSTNGTKKNGESVTRTRIAPGDEIAVGPVMVSVHIVSSIDEELRGFDGHDRFVAALAEEITRARTFERPLTLMLVRSAGAKDGHVNRWASRLRSRLRPVDRVGLYGPHAVLVSLPETSADAAKPLAAAIAGGDPPLTCRTVTFPADGSSVEELIAELQAVRRAPREMKEGGENSAVLAKNAAMKQVMATVKRVAGSTIAVLINGETGTGKEVIARAIHEAGPRKKQPLRSINCAAIPGQLIESLLFGHEKGAYTGADSSARGLFEQAEGGTVLLDEIGELPLEVQPALLGVLERRAFTRVGGGQSISADVRILAATHRDLRAEVNAGRFRADLYYRLAVAKILIPPLRERPEDIAPLVAHFVERLTGVAELGPLATALEALKAHPWSGNVRELRNVVEAALVMGELDLGGQRTPVAHVASSPETSVAAYRDARAAALASFEASYLKDLIERTDGNASEAARLAKMDRPYLLTLLRKHGLRG